MFQSINYLFIEDVGNVGAATELISDFADDVTGVTNYTWRQSLSSNK